MVTDPVPPVRPEARRRGPARVGHSNIRDVARHAGVSVATVSRVMSGSDQVSHATRDRVRASIAELGFVANGHARALGGRGTPLLALVVDDVVGPSFSMLARGVERVATENGHLFVMCTTHDRPERETEVVALLQEQRPAAVLWLGPLENDLERENRLAEYASTLELVGTRLLVCGRGPLRAAAGIGGVGYDNRGGARAVVEHLIGLGHRDILFAGARPGHLSSEHRLQGYLDAMADAGLPTPSRLRPDGDFGPDSGRRAVRDALTSGLRFTAVAGVVDSTAFGVMQELAAHGVSVPGDVSVTGFDDVNAFPGLEVDLTSAHVPFEEVGRAAGELALRRSPEAEHLTLPVTLHVRATTASMRARRAVSVRGCTASPRPTRMDPS